MIVRERTIYLDDSVLPQMGSVLRRSPSDFLVRIDGVPAELAAAGEGDPPEVAHLVWLDSDLASPAAIAGAAIQLAHALQSFPERESFSLVEANPASLSIHENLSRTELILRINRWAAEDAMMTGGTPMLEKRVAALNRLTVDIPGRRERDLGALWLISDPWPLEPPDLEILLRSESNETLLNTALGALQRTARVLSGSGWVTFPIWAPRPLLGDELRMSSQNSEYDRFLDRGNSPRADRPFPGYLRYILFNKRTRKKSKTPGSSIARSLDLATEVRLTPMALLARDTSGALAGDSFRILELAERLRNRRRLVVLDASPVAPELRKLDVLWIGGDGRAVPALPWVSSMTPRELGVARLLSVVEQARPRVGSPLRVRTSGTEEASPELCFAYPRPRGDLRMGWWNAAERRIEMGDAVSSPGSDTACARLPSQLGGADIVQLEDVDSLEWGAGQLSALERRQD